VTEKRVAITGLGVLSGYGRGTRALWEGLASGRSAVRSHRARLGRRAWLEYPMASLRDDTRSLARGLPKPGIVSSGRLDEDADLVALADCVSQAIEDSRITYDRAHNEIGLVVTHESPGLAPHVQSFFRWSSLMRSWIASRHRFNPQEFLYEQQSVSVYRMHSFLYIHHLSSLFDLHGFTLYNNNACSSGAFAMSLAADRIRTGQSRTVIVVGGDLPEDGTKYRWFADLGLYSDSGTCRPFSARRDGLVLGSGAAALVLEDLDQARDRGADIHAEWLGAGFSSDGWKVTLPDVVGGRYTEAIHRALDNAGVTPEEISLVCPHGVGSGLYDRYEAGCLRAVFGNGHGRGWPPMMPVKGAVGHTLGGCVLLETAAAILALARGGIPPAATCPDPDPDLHMPGGREGALPASWNLLKCANGFAGQNSAIVLRSPGDGPARRGA